MNQFYVGQDVVVVDDQVPLMGGTTIKDAVLTVGDVHRIRWLGMATHYVFGEYLGVKLEGVDSRFGEAWGIKDAPFNAKRFRPVVHDPLASLKNLAADPNGYVPGAPEEPKRVKIKEGEDA